MHLFQVLTVDLENQAAELQEEELPVAAPIINIPHISARWCQTGFFPHVFVAAHEGTRLSFCKPFTGCLTMNLSPLCGCCAPVCLGGWCVWGEQWSEWAALGPSVRRWRSDAWVVHTRSLSPFSRGSMWHPPRSVKLNTDFDFYPACTQLHAQIMMSVYDLTVRSGWLSQPLIRSLSEFSPHSDRRLADHQVSTTQYVAYYRKIYFYYFLGAGWCHYVQ